VDTASGAIAVFGCCAPSLNFCGSDLDGADADYLVAPAVNCLKLPEELSFEAGSVMTDMIGTQYSAQKRLGVSGAHDSGSLWYRSDGSRGRAVQKLRKRCGLRTATVCSSPARPADNSI
jgi:D-arabinose 1-dehydrogenase-like Zn-dependent alcohol dehydrogenase